MITIEISIGYDDETPEHEGYYYDFNSAYEALQELENYYNSMEYKIKEGIKNESCN